MLDVFIDSLIDTALLIPLLLAVHLLIELFEVRKLNKLKSGKVLKGGLAPLIGTGVGMLPQCGFSVVASELFAGKYIRIGTLIAVFIATSDEAIPILFGSAFTDPSAWLKLAELIGIKLVMALAAGYFLNLLFRKRELNADHKEIEHASEHGCCGHSLDGEHKDKHEESLAETKAAITYDAHAEHDHEHSHGEGDAVVAVREKSKARRVFDIYFKHPLIHTAIITLFVFLITFALGSIIFAVGGEEVFAGFMNQNVWLQPLASVLIGLIPNCAASVMITEMFVGGSLTLGAAVAGLAVNAGLGIAVLFKENKNLKHNFAILGGLVAYSVAVGYVITLIETLIA